MSQKITIVDVANKANVSPSTVSLVLNNKKGVGAETIDKVRRIAEEMGYHSTGGAPLKHTSGTILFIKLIKHGQILNKDHNPFIADYIDGLENTATVLGYKLEILSIDYASWGGIHRTVGEKNVTGVVLLGTELDPEDVELFDNFSCPLVFIDIFYDFLPYNFIDMNNIDSIFKIVTYLKRLGHKKIGVVQGTRLTPNFILREKGFRRSLDYYGVDFKQKWFYRVSTKINKVEEEMYNYFNNQSDVPTALICVNDIVALGCIRALTHLGISVPRDVSVVGYDNLQMGELSSPALTSYDVSKKLIARKSIELLHSQIMHNSSGSSVKMVISGELVERESCAVANNKGKCV